MLERYAREQLSALHPCGNTRADVHDAKAEGMWTEEEMAKKCGLTRCVPEQTLRFVRKGGGVSVGLTPAPQPRAPIRPCK